MTDATAREVYNALLGRPVPIAETLTLPERPVADRSLAGSDTIFDWLDDISHVRPDPARLMEIDMYRTLVGGAGAFTAGTSQHPRHSGDAWAATGAPEPATGGRSVVTSVWLGGSDQPPSDVVGLVVDQWSEQIPNASVITGVAFHYDAPSQRPPQALVLGVPQTTAPWTLEDAVRLVLDTIEWTQLRVVAPEDLGDFGHALPTVFTAEHLLVGATDGEDDS
jgi:hypothetical protein